MFAASTALATCDRLRSGKIPCPAVFFITLAICCVWQYPKEVSLAYALHASGFMMGAPFPAFMAAGRTVAIKRRLKAPLWRGSGPGGGAVLRNAYTASRGEQKRVLYSERPLHAQYSVVFPPASRRIPFSKRHGLSPGRPTAIAGPSKPAFAGNMRRITVS